MSAPASPARSPRSSRRASTSDPSEQAARLRVSATRLSRRLRQQADAGLSPSLLSALTAIYQHGSMTLGALADYERVAPPTVTKVVAKLEAEGLVVRETDAHDRRVSRVSLTSDGSALLAVGRRRKTAWLSDRIAQLSPDERARLAAALDVLDILTNDEPTSTRESP